MIRKIERADGTRWQVYGRRSGKQVYVGTYDSKRAAENAEQEHQVTQRKIDRGELPPRTDAKLTFGEAVERWLKALMENPTMKGSRSAEEYERRVNVHIKPTFERVPLVDIDRADVIAWRDARSREASVSAATVNTLLGCLSSAFSYFVDNGWIASNPCQRVKLLQATPKVFPWLQSSEAITRLLAECTPNIRELVAVLVGTGMRLDEALCLRWDDVDLEHRLLTVHRGRKGTTKSGKHRRVPIFDSVLPVLKAMKLRRGSNVYLWPGGKPGRPLSQPSVRAPFKRAVDHAELPATLRLHDLRHSFASLYLVDGGDIFKLSKILGHSSVAITERTYAHLKPDAFEADYGRVRFAMPSNENVISLRAS